MKARIASRIATIIAAGLAACALTALMASLTACTDSDSGGDTARVEASIGNTCGPADGREVWIRVAEKKAGENAIEACPAFSEDGLRIVLLTDGRGLEALETGSYPMRWAWDCRSGAEECLARRAAVTITGINDTEVLGKFVLFDTLGIQLEPSTPFKAARCVLTPLCG